MHGEYKQPAFAYAAKKVHTVCATTLADQLPFLAHLSRRLTGELIGYPWIRRPSSSSVVVRPSVVRPFTFSNIFSSETTWPIKAKFYVEPPWEGGTKFCINGPGHMTKMAAMPIYGIFFSRTGSTMILKLGMQHWGLKFYKVYINGDPGLTLTYFTARLILEI